MNWTDEAIVLSARSHGETSTIVTLLTAENGRHAGLVHGGQSRKKQHMLEAGNIVQASWRARLEDQLGFYNLEVMTPTAAPWLDHPRILAIIASATTLVEAALPERQSMPGIYNSLLALFQIRAPELWAPAYIKWEMGLLQELGFGLDLSSCALTGALDDLTHVSPRTGRAVTREAAEPYIEKLLPVPRFLCDSPEWEDEDIAMGLDLTAHFLSRHVFVNPQNRRLVPVDGMIPLARQRLTELYTPKTAKIEEEPSALLA